DTRVGDGDRIAIKKVNAKSRLDFSGPDIALLTARRQRNGRELDENRARWSAALASHSGRDATRSRIRCEGKLAFRVSTLPAWCTGRRRFHCSRRPRRFAQQDKSGAWIRSGHRDGGTDIRQRRAVARQPLRDRRKRDRRNEDNVSEWSAIPRVRT